MNPEEEKIDLVQIGIDIRLEVLNQIPKGFIDGNNEKEGRKIMNKMEHVSRSFPFRHELDNEEKAHEDEIVQEQRAPKR
jgi:hypothetical protein